MFKGKFQIEDGPIYEGYTNGNHWNGWACPYFTREVADQIAREVNADAPDCTIRQTMLLPTRDIWKKKSLSSRERTFKGNTFIPLVLTLGFGTT